MIVDRNYEWSAISKINYITTNVISRLESLLPSGSTTTVLVLVLVVVLVEGIYGLFLPVPFAPFVT